MFVDRVQVILRAGDGGNGALSFRHEKFRPKGGPDGGDGGNGGSVILRASRNQNTLATFRYKKLLKAQDGQPGAKSKRHGKSGEDLLVDVPVGTVVNSSGQTLSDLAADGQEFVVAKGGKGGFGNAHFVSSIRQAPRIAEKGEKGQQLEGIMELKMIADVGIVGLPNAGKSTLLSVISNAKPEIADYPFTTLTPNLGVVDIDKKHSLLFADIPGLIKGASQGRGLGDEFLRHVERTSVLVHLIDVYNEDVAEAYRTIMSELAAYQVDLSKKPQIVTLTKIDGFDKKELNKKIARLKKVLPRGTLLLAISNTNRQGMEELLRAALSKVNKAHKKVHRTSRKLRLPTIGLKDNDDSWAVQKAGRVFIITGKKVERFANRINFNDYHGQQRLRDILRKMGVMRELERQNIEPGQVVQIGNPKIGELEY
jgi:GTP-binding protein